MVWKRFWPALLSIASLLCSHGLVEAKKGIGCGKDKIRICGAANVKTCDLSKHLSELSMSCVMKLNQKAAKASMSGRK